MYITQVLPEARRLSSHDTEKMSFEAPSDIETPPPSREGSQYGDTECVSICESEAPKSPSSSPWTLSINIKTEDLSASQPRNSLSSASRATYAAPPLPSPVKLPSLNEFDQGVEALARSYGPTIAAWTPTLTVVASPERVQHPEQLSTPPAHAYSGIDTYSYPGGPPHHYQSTFSYDGYPSPPPDCESRHINKKYTTEEGDFIIYAWHDKKQKWQTIQKQFARMFGKTPERSIQGLQAWYYRMNGRIPVWDNEGWLVFDNEDEVEPRYVSVKCRDRDQGHKGTPEYGLAQRYPERALGYPWVDAETKRQARDWAAKRTRQYRERRERRKKKEAMRARL